MGEGKRRIEWIDIAKGIGILLVVLAHLNRNMSEGFVTYAYSFHLPLFFFLSGYLFSHEKYKSSKEFVISRFKALIVPYMFFAAISLALTLIVSRHDLHLSDAISQALYINGASLQSNRPIWFLVCIFFVELFFYLLGKVIKREIFMAPAVLLSSVIGYLLYLFLLPKRLPFGIDIAFTALAFYGAGNLLKRKQPEFKLGIPKLLLAAVGVILGVLISVFLQTVNVDMYKLTYGNYFYFYMAAFLGIASTIVFSQFISKTIFSKLFSYFGRNSLIIMCTHYLIIFVVTLFEGKILKKTSLFDIHSNFLGLVNLAIVVLVSIPVIYVLDRYFPVLVGKKR